MKLVNVYRTPDAVKVLYDLLRDRPVESHISHDTMPTFRQHRAFVRSKPYRFWYLIEEAGEFVGDLHVTALNEIGIFLFGRFRGAGHGARAMTLFTETHKPLPAIRAVRVNRWLAHIAPDNAAGVEFFRGIGFRKVQETYAYG